MVTKKYYLIQQLTKDGEQIFEEIQGLPEDKLKEEIVEIFKQKILDDDVEIYKIFGYQFVTSKGVMLICSEDEIAPTENEYEKTAEDFIEKYTGGLKEDEDVSIDLPELMREFAKFHIQIFRMRVLNLLKDDRPSYVELKEELIKIYPLDEIK